ncbi:hypothetical protein ACQZ42_17570 [Rhizobium rhizogenes]
MRFTQRMTVTTLTSIISAASVIGRCCDSSRTNSSSFLNFRPDGGVPVVRRKMHIAGEAAEDGETGFGWAARADNTVSSPLQQGQYGGTSGTC